MPFGPEAGKEILRRLNPEFFRGTASGYSRAIVPGPLLFGGRLTLNSDVDGDAFLTVHLEMNLTRFLAQRYEQLTQPDDLRRLSTGGLNEILRNQSFGPRRRRGGESLDNNDNVISDRILRSGQAPNHLDWMLPYIEAVCRFLTAELSGAGQRAIDAGAIPAFRQNPLVAPSSSALVAVPMMNWSLPQLEIYWEFWSQNAISQAGDMSLLLQQVAPNSRLTAWAPITSENDQALLGISTGLGVEGAVAKMYAKLAHRIRVEIEYSKNPKQIERVPASEIDRLNPEGLPRFVAGISRRAATRADRLMQRAAASAVRSNAPVSQVFVASFFEAIAREAETPFVFNIIIRTLMANGRVPAQRNLPQLRHAMQRLVANRYFEGVAIGRARTFNSYRPLSPYDRIVQALRDLTLSS